jgi:hypothetical protein
MPSMTAGILTKPKLTPQTNAARSRPAPPLALLILRGLDPEMGRLGRVIPIFW